MSRLDRHWQGITPLTLLLAPLSALFAMAVGLRRALYRRGLLPRTKLPVPVIIVGNINVGGTGKTPVVIWLAAFLAERGMRPGIVSRGYGGRNAVPRQVTATSDPQDCGDEPVLIAQRSGRPVWIGADRVAAARALLAANPDCDVIVADDGLQHYRLRRDVEIAVVDGARGLGNGLLLPAGPLREPHSRLSEVDMLVVNGSGVGLKARAVTAIHMGLKPSGFYQLRDPARRESAGIFGKGSVHAVAGIGNPERFFELLRRLGVAFTAHPFPDHHPFQPADIAFPGADFIVMTEKDAVKCQAFADERHWALGVDADVDASLGDHVLKKIGRPA